MRQLHAAFQKHNMKCDNCGQEYNENETQCSKCGSNVVGKRSIDTLQIAVSEQIAVSGHARLEGREEGKTVGFRESPTSQQSSDAETHKDGTVSSWLKGPPVQGEDDTKPAGQMLAQAMSTANEQWEL